MVRDKQTSILSFVGGSENRNGVGLVMSPARARPYPSTAQRRAKQHVSDSEDEDGDEGGGSDSSSLGRIKFESRKSRPDEEDEEVERDELEDSESEAEEAMTLGARREAKKRVVSDDELEESAGEGSGSEAEAVPPKRNGVGIRKGKEVANGRRAETPDGDVIVLDDSEDEPAVSPTRSAKKIKNKNMSVRSTPRSRRHASEDQNDSAEEPAAGPSRSAKKSGIPHKTSPQRPTPHSRRKILEEDSDYEPSESPAPRVTDTPSAHLRDRARAVPTRAHPSTSPSRKRRLLPSLSPTPSLSVVADNLPDAAPDLNLDKVVIRSSQGPRLSDDDDNDSEPVKVPVKHARPPVTPPRSSKPRNIARSVSKQLFDGVHLPSPPPDRASYTPSPIKRRKVQVEVEIASPKRPFRKVSSPVAEQPAPRRATRSGAVARKSPQAAMTTRSRLASRADSRSSVKGTARSRQTRTQRSESPESADDGLASSSRPATRSGARSRHAGRRAASPEVLDLEFDSSHDILQVRKQKGKGRARVVDPDDSESEYQASESPVRQAKPRKRRARDPDESDESMPDPAELLAEIEMDEPVQTQSRLRDRAPKENKFSQALAKLKGECVDMSLGSQRLTPSLASEARKAGQAIDQRTEDAEEDMWRYESEEEASEEDRFIEEDGGFDANQLPIEYRLSSFQHFSHHFKVIAQYFVNLAVIGDSYAAEKDAAYYRVAFQAFRKKLDGLRDSQIASSIWRSNFKRALSAYPEFESAMLDEAVDGCDACHMGGRMSKYVGSLGGSKYDPKTFNILPREDSDSEDDDDDFDRKQFKLGRFCRIRVEVYHDFSHWELAIYTAMSQPYELLKKRVRNGERVQGWTGKLRDPDAVLKYLDDTGKIEREWQRISDMIKKAEQLDSMGADRGRDMD